ncbi:MAG: TIGR01459 family HAD-type hydrolase [Hyphomicrobium sp.]|nr:TIGR01459 family HAD-type hydrolase [Hyphomicrobium sp.]PPD08620.1 MAG: TIGR01459 family HAD-type hydrolase [Hyphomicrobium sp.]
MTQRADIPILSSIAPLAVGRTAWLVDIWGVMHNGVTPFLPAADACARFRRSGGTVLLLSNAPRPAASVVEQLDRIGVPRESYDTILTSGDASREMIQRAAEAGRAIGHIGPERDRGLFEGAADPVPMAKAQTVVCSGLYDDERETPETYIEILALLKKRGVDMICANPDLTVERGGRIIYCAGALAKAYEDMGGAVAYAGKPYLPVYDLAFERLEALRGTAIPRGEVLAIGDGVGTDIAGAAAAGIDSVYVASGVHAGPGGRIDASTVAEIFADTEGWPIAAMNGLAWG